MATPAQRHAMRVSAIRASQRDKAPLRHASPYEQMLVKLAADRRTLSAIRSKERKADKKRELLPLYLPWVAGVLENGTGAQDDILMTVMLWRLDAGDITGAIEIARYALRFGLSMPEKHSRTAPYMLAEEVALAATRARIAGEPVEAEQLLYVIGLTAEADMPDEVRARLYKVAGLTLRDAGQPENALSHLQRALQLDTNVGVRKDIETLTRELNPKPATVKKTAPKVAKRVSAIKQNSPVKRGRGRPKKVAG
ncbi:terminase endonuclease subunit [Klebsiella michiganensis]|uniref:phage terminase small subunit n=1 Tax=Klebsiella michiganensis TaxID=1134687 RepID=UPI0004A86C17|nr:terminase endonuclease subunit [Klebsiella michiganensis]AID91665.1 terminase [Klebsiella oxytoca KONIH1]AUV90908.1 terminase [Klebsiella oxytoca]POT85757.1 terminase [Klebsiella oxytoca]POV48432.1 terminase [Klebsiella oxytoca]